MTRLGFATTSPDVYAAQRALSQAAAAAWERSGLPMPLLELLRLRASQINGCAFCIDMHATDARKAGEDEARLLLLDAWREAPHYSDTERVVLALAEALTLIAGDHVPDEVWGAAATVLTDEQLAAVVGAAVAINGWNRIAISTRMAPAR